mmetsp:Transcript_82473/g.238204  ORF Transcript_82473/g.238204 Transcript_82473/m.238204 type:complete len:237 (-) Transcript_82473:125-835(-)
MSALETLFDDLQRGNTEAIIAIMVTAMTLCMIVSMACLTCAKLQRLREAEYEEKQEQKQKSVVPESETVAAAKDLAAIQTMWEAYIEDAKLYPPSAEKEEPETPPVVSEDEGLDGQLSKHSPRRMGISGGGIASALFKDLLCSTSPTTCDDLKDGQQVEFYSREDNTWLRGTLRITQERMFEMFVGETKFHLIVKDERTGQRRVLKDVPKHLVRPVPQIQLSFEDIDIVEPPEFSV